MRNLDTIIAGPGSQSEAGGGVKSVNTVYVASSRLDKGMKGSITTQVCVCVCVRSRTPCWIRHIFTFLSLPLSHAHSVTLPLPLTRPRPRLHTTERVAFPKVDPGAFIQPSSCRDVCLLAARPPHLLIRGGEKRSSSRRSSWIVTVPNCWSPRPTRFNAVHGNQEAQSHISHRNLCCSQPEGKRKDGAADPSLFGTLLNFYLIPN